MSKIQQTLDALQPYVIGIRYLEGTPIVDAVFKEGWTLPESTNIKKLKGNEEMNYHMLFSESPSIGLDELLEYVDKVIKANQEREKKHELLRVKVNELKELFKNKSLNKLKTLRFTFNEDDEFTTNLDDISIDEDVKNEVPAPVINDEMIQEPIQEIQNQITPEMDDEEKEMLEEEARAERNRNIFKNKATKPKVELPPKRKIEMALASNGFDNDSDCDCGPNEACDKCINDKDL
jgi:hypothetical protein